MSYDFQPLLSAKLTKFDKLDYSNLYGSPKLDGIRALVVNGMVMSRTMKPIPNVHVQYVFGNRPELEGYDGELIVGEPNAHDVYRQTYSGVMKASGEPAAKFYAFDRIDAPSHNYLTRYTSLSEHEGIVLVPQTQIFDQEHLFTFERDMLENGYEGIMLRAGVGANSHYRYGRATEKSQTLLKLKRFMDAEALVIGYEEEMFNGNVAEKDAFGRTKRSSHQENKVGKGRLGSLVCRTDDGVEFRIGTGFDAADREELWGIRDQLPGRIVKYKSFHIGVKEAPRFPVWLGWRSQLDL